jgi:4-hydroxybenzoate polyprenyltransferase
VKLGDTVRNWARMLRFSHSVFAIPFALTGATLATTVSPIRPLQVAWILVAMVGARNAAMGFNRLADHAIDERNPRTADRELPAGRLSRRAVWAFTAALSALFVVAAFQLGPLCGQLSPVALAIVFGYSYTKRFTWTSHAFLGLALAIAPIGGWLAVAGSIDRLPVVLGLAVLLWVAGFDVVYACQDTAFDRGAGLHSLPARFGVSVAMAIARALHAAALATLAVVGWLGRLHPVYWVGWVAVGGVLVSAHRLVRADDPSQSGGAFLSRNGAVAVLYFGAVLAAVLAGDGRGG